MSPEKYYANLSDDALILAASQEIRNEAVLMDNAVMREIFADKACTQLLVNTILKRTDLIVQSVATEENLSNYRHRSVCLDIYATDKHHSIYNIEIQKDSRGAIPRRARFHSSSIDVHALKEGEDFADLPVTYVIFITQRDIWKKRLPLYSIDRIIRELDEPFDDGAHIIYVNASYNENDAIGRMMQDFHCPAPNKMHYQLLAERMRNLKGDEVKMGSAIEELKRRSKDQGKLDGMLQSSLDTAKKLKQLNKMSIEEIAEVTNLTLEQVKAITA